MSGICSKHRGHDPYCKYCNLGTEAIQGFDEKVAEAKKAGTHICKKCRFLFYLTVHHCPSCGTGVMPPISPMLKALLEQRQDIEMVLRSVEGMHSKNESRIYDEIKAGPKVYGRCIKALECVHQSDIHKAGDVTIIMEGDVVHFRSYPLYKSVTFHPCYGEHFDVNMDPKHFEFFESTEDIKCFSADNQ
jgi:hypothetical protein